METKAKPDGAEDLDLETLFARPDKTFVLKMTNDSLSGDHVLSGDYVVLEKRHCLDGEIAAVLIDGAEATLRRVRFGDGGNTLRLECSNPAFPDRTVEKGRCAIRGVLCGVLRTIA